MHRYRTWHNAAAGFPQRNLDMLTGAGQYVGLATQINYDPAVYAQIAAVAIKAWKALPNKGAREQLSKVLQGPSEPYPESVDCLLQLGVAFFADVDTAMPVIKQLAYENANRYCQEAIRPHRNRSLNDFIWLCKDIDGTHVIGQVIASALRGSQGGARSKTCFQCRQLGHFKRNCPVCKGAGSQPRGNSGICPKYQKGAPWANECCSKTDIQGNPLPMSENGRRGLPQAPKTQVYGTMSRPAVPIRFIPQMPRLCPRHPRKCQTGPLYLRPGSIDPTDGCSGLGDWSIWTYSRGYSRISLR